MTALMEPFQHSKHVHRYKRRLGMHTVGANSNGKIWFFVNKHTEVEIISDI